MLCPKCGKTMMGPIWNKAWDRMDYRCRCGYRTSRPPYDKAECWQEREGVSDVLYELRRIFSLR